MKTLYTQITDKLLEGLYKYKTSKVDNLRELFDFEDMVYNYNSWPELEQTYKNNIFNAQITLFKHLLKVDQYLNFYDSINSDKEIEIDIKNLKMHSQMLSRNCEPPEGFSNSPWYLPFVPNINMIEFLHEDEN